MLNRNSQSDEKSVAGTGDWLQRRSVALQIGLVLGSAHLLFVLANVIGVIYYQERRWIMFWTLCGYLDFPVSLLLSKVILPVFSPMITPYDPYLVSSRGPIFTIFLLFHTIIGSVWYCILPVLLQKAAQKITATTAGAIAAGVMMIIPVFANWLQLLRFIGGNTPATSIGLNSVLPAVWVVLFIWLLFTNVRRMRLCWLFCLTPAVFYYLVADVYYCILRNSH
ncbi:MAG: hypothetical protein ABSB91_06095 [Sedimentisphaerales bacterium]